MFIIVRLLNNFSKNLTYSVPAELQNSILIGTLVQVPLQKRLESAIVVGFQDSSTIFNFKIREIDSIFPFPADSTYHQFATQLAVFHQIDFLYFFKRLKNFLVEEQDIVEVVEAQDSFENKVINLTGEQIAAYQSIMHNVQAGAYQATVLHGVTGSGKTEVYKKLFLSVLAQNKSGMLLLPEVGLAVQFENLLKSTLKNVEIFGFHSGTTVKQKKLLWQKAQYPRDFTKFWTAVI